MQDLAEKFWNKQVYIDRIYASDLRRAEETAGILSSRLGSPTEWVPELRETNNGVLAGMENHLADERYPGVYWSTLEYEECYPGGESPALFYRRVQAAWTALKRKAIRRAEENILLVTHGGVIEAILCMENRIAFSNREKHFSIPYAAAIPVSVQDSP